ncbi:MAG: RnfABCDGE type electron transport complex subunit G [Eubacteriales bacterium]|nr:RnfABCDGE type electron transport complex subunit G [Eubacteriales bacterium]
MESSKKEGGILQLILVLGLITLVCALLLGVANGVTADKIEQNKIDTRNAAMAEIIPGASFEDTGTALSAEEVAAAGVTLPAGRTAAAIAGVYKATVDGADAGYCFEVQPKGFGGTLTMIVGVGADGTVAGVKVTGHAETPGLGAKSQTDEEWIAQYAGQPANGQLQVSKDGGTINAITGATITSRAVTDGVNTAAAYAATLG